MKTAEERRQEISHRKNNPISQIEKDLEWVDWWMSGPSMWSGMRFNDSQFSDDSLLCIAKMLEGYGYNVEQHINKSYKLSDKEIYHSYIQVKW